MSDKQLLQELISYRHRLQLALKSAKLCVFEVDLVHQYYVFLENTEDIFGVPGSVILQDMGSFRHYSPEAFRHAICSYFYHPSDAATVAKAYAANFGGRSCSFEARMRVRNTPFKWCKVDITPVLQGGVPARLIGVITDIDHIHVNMDALNAQVMRDSYTNLYNKKSTEELVNAAIGRNPNRQHAFILFDLDYFKQLNDTYGHPIGDEVVKSVAQHTCRLFRSTDLVGRVGGDEFAVFVKDLPSRGYLHARVRRLLREHDNAYAITKSIGVALSPRHGTDYQTLFKHADIALYRSKQSKNSISYYAQEPELPKRRAEQ